MISGTCFLSIYTLPPFSLNGKPISLGHGCLIGMSITKLIWERTLVIMIILYWPTQNCFPLMTKCLVDYPVEIITTMQCLIHPADWNRRYLLASKLKLMAVLLLGMPSKYQLLRMKSEELSVTHGKHDQRTIAFNRMSIGMFQAWTTFSNSFMLGIKLVVFIMENVWHEAHFLVL